MVDSCSDFFEPLTDKNIVAKKQHRCCECGRFIIPGEKYNYQAGISDGFNVFKTCMHCTFPRNLIREKCRGFIYEEIKSDLREHFPVKEWGYKAARYFVAMQRKWKRFKSDELMPLPKA